MTKDQEIIEKSKEIAQWMKRNGWYDAKRIPDEFAAEFSGFDKLLLNLCDKCLQKDVDIVEKV